MVLKQAAICAVCFLVGGLTEAFAMHMLLSPWVAPLFGAMALGAWIMVDINDV